ncbi:hypothetical protein MKK68_20065 [Methylobacterium sp. E-016]|uniref:hypothetical protein n=1 Tax=Methylobacterium sp. E-016 TaxID=2836556 RepID=UPI001FBABF92|nr:hypothetical protein [Methylobacterium sp. E-016]MCJ2077910.1 hypothetical protein [Methylobacterium sp. E-016]
MMKFSERRARQRARQFSMEQAGDLAAERIGLLGDAFAGLAETVNAITAAHHAGGITLAQHEALKRWALQVAPVFTHAAGVIEESDERLRRIFEPGEAA